MPKTPGAPHSGSSGLDQDDITTHPDLFNADDTDTIFVMDEEGEVVEEKHRNLQGLNELDFSVDMPSTTTGTIWEMTRAIGAEAKKWYEVDKRKKKEANTKRAERVRERDEALRAELEPQVVQWSVDGKTPEEMVDLSIQFFRSRGLRPEGVFRILKPNVPVTKSELERRIRVIYFPPAPPRPARPAAAPTASAAPASPANTSGAIEKYAMMAALPTAALGGLAAYGTYKVGSKVAKVGWGSGKELVKGTANTLLQAGETVLVNPFKIVGRVVSTPFKRAAEFWNKGKKYPEEPKKEAKFLSRAWYRMKQSVLAPAGLVAGLAVGAVEGPAVAIAKDVVGVQWTNEAVDSEAGEEKKTKRTYSLDHGGIGGIGAALWETTRGTFYDGPKSAFEKAEQGPDTPEKVAELSARVLGEEAVNEIKGTKSVEDALNMAATFLAAKEIDPAKFFAGAELSVAPSKNNIEVWGDLMRTWKSARRIYNADVADPADIESAIDDAVDLLNLEEKFGPVAAFAGSAVMWGKGLVWPTVKPKEVKWDSFGGQIAALKEKEDVQAFVKGVDMDELRHKFRLLVNPERLDAALETEGGRAEAKKQLGIFIGRPDEEIDGPELLELIEGLTKKLGETDKLTKSVRKNHAEILAVVQGVSRVVTPARLTLMHTGNKESITVDYDRFGDQIGESLDTEGKRDAFLRVFNAATFARTFRVLTSPARLMQAVQEDKATVLKQVNALFDLEGVFDATELTAHAEAIMASLGDPTTIPDAGVKAKCQEARGFVAQCHANLVTPGVLDALFEKPVKITPVDFDRFGDQLLEEVNTPEEINAFLRGFRMLRFENAFRIVLSQSVLVATLADDPKEVQKKIDQLFDLSGYYTQADVERHASQMVDLFRTHSFPSTEVRTKAEQMLTAVAQVVQNLETENVVAKLMEKPKDKEIDVQKFGAEVLGIKDEEVIPALRAVNMFTVAATFGRLRDVTLVEELSKSKDGKDELKALIAQFFGLKTPVGANEIRVFGEQFEAKFAPSRADRSSIESRNFNELNRLIRDVGTTLSAARLREIYKKEETPAVTVEAPAPVAAEAVQKIDAKSFASEYAVLFDPNQVDSLMSRPQTRRVLEIMIREMLNLGEAEVVTYQMLKDLPTSFDSHPESIRMKELVGRIRAVLTPERFEEIFPASVRKTA